MFFPLSSDAIDISAPSERLDYISPVVGCLMSIIKDTFAIDTELMTDGM